jgi:hypothetical protein
MHPRRAKLMWGLDPSAASKSAAARLLGGQARWFWQARNALKSLRSGYARVPLQCARRWLTQRQAISIVVHTEKEDPVVHRLKRGSHVIVKATSAITSVEVDPLHPVLSGDEYAALCR